jgi:hypothetical protein
MAQERAVNGKHYPSAGLVPAEMLAGWRAAFAQMEREIQEEEKALDEKRMRRDQLRVLIENATVFVTAGNHDVIMPSPAIQIVRVDETPPPSPPTDPRPPTFDGSLAGLVSLYLSDERSPYCKVRFQTRRNYDVMCSRIIRDCGTEKLANLKAQQIQGFYDRWKGDDKMAMAHSLATMLRALINFGATIIKDGECERLSVVLHNLRFKVAKSSSEPLTAEDARAIIRKAHAVGYNSIALAQAFQFECKLRQKDVIGEWVPISENDSPSDVTNGKNKWLQGIRWSEIDEKMIMRHTTSRRQKEIEIDLKLAPMVMDEFKRMGTLPSSGPIIEFEKTGRPYETFQFRREWRLIANAVGIPKHVKNMDSISVVGRYSPSAQMREQESAR